MLFNTPGNTVDVKAFPKQYIHPKVDFNTRLRKVKNYKKLLVLSMRIFLYSINLKKYQMKLGEILIKKNIQILMYNFGHIQMRQKENKHM